MENLVEKEAKKFIEREFYGGLKIRNFDNLHSDLKSKLRPFSRERDKLDFLKICRQESVREKENHMKSCAKGGCQFEEIRDTGIFVIDQEIDYINRFYKFEPNSEDKFTSEEESELHCKLNDIAKKLEQLGIKQAKILEEIESLKNHFNLGKREWFQLLKGKLIDLVIERVLDKETIAVIYDYLSEGFKNITKLLGY